MRVRWAIQQLKLGIWLQREYSKKSRILSKNEHSVPLTQWVWNDSIADIFPERQTVKIRNDFQTGPWRQRNPVLMLRNDTSIQALFHSKLHILQASFYQSMVNTVAIPARLPVLHHLR